MQQQVNFMKLDTVKVQPGKGGEKGFSPLLAKSLRNFNPNCKSLNILGY